VQELLLRAHFKMRCTFLARSAINYGWLNPL
jgi:hypothetical protein